MSDPNRYPEGLNAEKVDRIVDHYCRQSDEEAAAEIEKAYDEAATIIEVPNDLVPQVLALIQEHERNRASR